MNGRYEDDDLENVLENGIGVENEEVIHLENGNPSKSNQPDPRLPPSGTGTSAFGLQVVGESARREVKNGISVQPIIHKRSGKN